MQWGQFLDHDMDHSMEAISRETFENGITCSATCENRPPCFPIKTPPHDQRYHIENCQKLLTITVLVGYTIVIAWSSPDLVQLVDQVAHLCSLTPYKVENN
jgi:hypothetical protein